MAITLLETLSLHLFRQGTFQGLQGLIQGWIVLQPLPDHPTDVYRPDKGTAVVVISYFNIAMRLNASGNVGIEVFKRAIY